MTRRETLRVAARAGFALPFASGCISRRPQARLLPSRVPLPEPFKAPLPIAAVLRPVRADESGDYYEMTARVGEARILPGAATKIWGYNGTFPGPTIEARRGRSASLKLRNELPAPLVNHLHGGRTPPESDGYPTDLVLPVGGFSPKHSGGHMADPRARVADGVREYVYPNQQRAATLWYHDHRMDFTAAQVWRGLAAFYILRDEEEEALPLPKGTKEVALAICDRSFDADGSFLYPAADPALADAMSLDPEYRGGVLGDVILVNGAPWPVLEVANTKYRFRILNGSNARRYELALDPAVPGGSFVQIGSDGGLLGTPISHRTIRTAPAERFDVVVDFSRFAVGSRVTMRNLADHGATGQIMQFHVVRAERDESSVPERLSALREPDRNAAAVTRVFRLSYGRGDVGWTINGKPFDPMRMDARPALGSREIWRIETDFSHPLHLHLVHFRVLGHSGRPGAYDAGWKDTIDLGPGETANLLIPFEGYRGRYVFHCHNLEHEDMSMMGNFEVV
jgi:spore coat protein A